MRKSNGSQDTLSKQFQANAAHSSGKKKYKPPQPFSIRFSEEERARLRREAGKLSLAAHIRQRLFGDAASPRKTRRPVKKRRRPTLDQQALGKVLAALGRSRLASNLNQIAKAAHIGSLPVTPDLTEELHTACADIRAMRRDLIAALGIKPESGESSCAKATEE